MHSVSRLFRFRHSRPDKNQALRSQSQRHALAFVLLIFSMPSDQAEASPLELFGFGSRAPAMAGGGVADSEGFSAAYTNPAGLAFVTRKRVTVGTAVTRFGLSVDGSSAGVDNSTALVLGGAVPIPLGGIMKGRVALGLGFHVPNKTLVRVDRPAVGEPTFALLDNRADAVGVHAAVGVRITDKWSIGAGVLILGGLRGTIRVRNDAAGAFVTTSDQRLVTDISPIIGGHFRFSQRFSTGLTVRAPSRSDYNIEIDTDLEAIPIGLPELAVAGNAQYDPLMVALGGALVLRPDVKLLVDIEYRRWSAFPRPTKNPVVNNPAPPPPHFRDTAVPKISTEVTRAIGKSLVRFRGGYAFHLSPAPEMDGPITLLDNHRHVVAVGAGVSFAIASVPMFIDAWTQAHFLQQRKHQKDPSQFEEPPEQMTVRSSGQVFAGGLTVGVEL